MEKVVVNSEFLNIHNACEWYRRFIRKVFPQGTEVTRVNVKKLLAAIKKERDSENGRVYDLRAQQNIFGTCLNFMLYKVKGISTLANEYNLESTKFVVIEKAFWELWGEEKKETAQEKWLREINGSDIAGVPIQVDMARGKVYTVTLGHSYIFSKKDILKLMKLVKWDVPAKKKGKK